MTIPRPSMIAIIDEPPYDIMGKGDPTIGSRPRTIIIFTATYKKKAVAKLQQYNLPKLLLVIFPILIILEIINAYKSKINNDPKNPNSSEKSVKIKSVCFSGK